MWDEVDGLYYDKLVTPSGTSVPIKVRSMVGIIPLLAAVVVDESPSTGPSRCKGMARLLEELGGRAGSSVMACLGEPGSGGSCWASSAWTDSSACSRSSSTRTSSCRRTACGPCPPTTVTTCMCSRSRACKRPSTTSRPSPRPTCSAATPTGGADLVPAQLPGRQRLERYHRFFGDELTVEYPTGSGSAHPRRDRRRPSPPPHRAVRNGSRRRRPCFGGVERLQVDPAWKGNLVFSEYFHGDDGAAWALHTRPVGRASWPTSSAAGPATACTLRQKRPASSCGRRYPRPSRCRPVHPHWMMLDRLGRPIL